ncbi:MAG TPA: ATP-binding cassette domain-containing protein, partial [Actinopolymorphaceae bacterium]|nr:ATP-binding cassette domain-containing protein [Actinopolymorphaceae bacterium]
TQAGELAERGYVVLTWTAEGFGRSGGKVHLDSPDYEVADARRLVDRLARRADVRRDGPGDPRVGVVGSSYGGALALLLAGHDRRIDAIVPQSTWNDLARALFPEATGRGPRDGVFKQVWAGWLYAAGLGGRGSLPELTPTPAGDSLTDPGSLLSLTMPADPKAGGKSGPPALPPLGAPGANPAACGRYALDVCRMYQRTALTGRADAATVRLLERSSPASVIGRIKAPTLLVQGTADTLFPLSEADANEAGIRSAGTPVRMMWFSGGHDAGAGSRLDQIRVKTATVGWLDNYLKGNGHYPRRSFAFSRVSGVDYRNGSVRTVGLFAPHGYPGLDGDEHAREVPLVGQARVISNPPAGSPAGISSVPGLGALTGTLLTHVTLDIPGEAVSYDSAPLAAGVDVTGVPTVRLRAASRSGSAVLFVKLYDVAPSGQVELPGGNVAPVRLDNLPSSIESAKPVTVTLPGMVHRFQPGHRLRVTVATADQSYAGPNEPQVYVASLAGGGVRLPQVEAVTAGDSAGPWAKVLLAVTGVLVLAAGAVWILARRRGRRRIRRLVAEHADTPLVVQGLGKSYREGQHALRGVDFTVRPGEVVGLLGPNGAGKTTCLRIIAGLVRPTSGEVLVFGHALTPGAPVLSRTGLLVEGPGFLPHLSGRANLELFWAATGRAPAEARLDEVLEIAGLGAALERRVREYSHGMTQRLAIAQAMLGMPDLLVLDEPTDGLDPPQIAALRRVLRRYAAGGRSVLVSSHLLAEVEETCTHVVVLHRGRCLAAGRVDEIVGDSGSVQVDVNDADRAEALLAAIEVRSVARHNGGVVVDLDGVDRSVVVRTLVAGGVDVSRVAPTGRLEDVFLHLVNRGSESEPESEPGSVSVSGSESKSKSEEAKDLS